MITFLLISFYKSLIVRLIQFSLMMFITIFTFSNAVSYSTFLIVVGGAYLAIVKELVKYTYIKDYNLF